MPGRLHGGADPGAPARGVAASCATASCRRCSSADYDRCQRGAQFLTEVQGGSDVGANATEAVPDGDAWRLTGEKWFCSVVDADQFVVTARPHGAPAGTRGHRLLPRPARSSTASRTVSASTG